MGPGDLAQVLCHLPQSKDPNVLVGTKTSDDAGVYRISDELALVQTLDFITPIVDDPFVYGQVAAANSLSDVYAMGGTPLCALNVVCFPSRTQPMEVLGRMLAGGASKTEEAGIEVIGGHSVDDPEPKYGLVVTGRVHPNRILTNAGSLPGDHLILTKPIGSGILTTAIKKRALPGESSSQVIDVMTTLNRTAAEVLDDFEVSAATDITGFGLIGHLHEMTVGVGMSAVVQSRAVPLMDRVVEMARQGLVPGGAQRNFDRVSGTVSWGSDISDEMQKVLCDPQTSGGLLIAIAERHADQLIKRLQSVGVKAADIGEIRSSDEPNIEVQ